MSTHYDVVTLFHPDFAVLCNRHHVDEAALTSVLDSLIATACIPQSRAIGLCDEGIVSSPYFDWVQRGCRAEECFLVPWVRVHESLGRSPAGSTVWWLCYRGRNQHGTRLH